MNRLFMLGAMFALAVGLTVVKAEDDKDTKTDKKKDEKPLTIKQIMKRSHGKVGTFQAKSSEALKAKDFEKLGKIAAEWKKDAEALAKAKPKKGDADSWETQTSAYTKAITTLGEAAEDKDAKKAQGALGYVGSSCAKCHGPHK